MVEPSHTTLSLTTQCRLLSLSRSGWYFEPKGEPPLNLKLVRLIDGQLVSAHALLRLATDGSLGNATGL